MKNLSKNTVLKKKKQQLCDRINQCKSLKEIEGWKRTFSYHDVLKNNYDWDENYFFDLIKFKLRRMSQYFHTHRIVENEDWYGTLCDRAVAILDAGYGTNIVLSKDLNGIYVNTRNVKRFVPKFFHQHLENRDEYWNKYGLAMIREYKAKVLFWKFLHHYVEILWD